MHPTRRNKERETRCTPPHRQPSHEFNEFFSRIASPVLQSENTVRTRRYTQHGCISCYDHSLAVAYYSLRFADLCRIRCNRESLVKGALLHDYFLYDWHEKDRSHRLHGFTHAKTALKNASLEYALSDIEKDIISRHMFPLNLTPPHFRESLVVCLVDKFCSLAEVFGLDAYPSSVRFYGTKAL